jgi:transposase
LQSAQVRASYVRRCLAFSPRAARHQGLAMDWRQLDERIAGLSAEIEAVASADAGCDRLMSIPGLGPIIASATVAAIGAGGRAPPYQPHRPRALVPRPQSGKRHSDRRVSTWRNAPPRHLARRQSSRLPSGCRQLCTGGRCPPSRSRTLQ